MSSPISIPIILEPPNILVALSASPRDITPQKSNFAIGYVCSVSQLSTQVTTGQYVMFDINNARAFLYGSTIYYIVDENNLFYKENTPT